MSKRQATFAPVPSRAKLAEKPNKIPNAVWSEGISLCTQYRPNRTAEGDMKQHSPTSARTSQGHHEYLLACFRQRRRGKS